MVKIVIYAFLYAIFNVSGAVIMKSKLLTNKVETVHEFLIFLMDIKILGAIGLIFISMFFTIKAFSLGKMSEIIPILTGVNFVVTIIFGYFIFHNSISAIHYVGIFLIFCGIVLVGS